MHRLNKKIGPKNVTRPTGKTITLLTLLMFTLASSPVLALSDSDAHSIYNDSPWYRVGLEDCTEGSDDPLGADLPADIIKAINQLKSTYMKAADATNVPWQFIAALHYRETGFAINGSNLFQIGGYSGPTDLLSQAIAAGNFVQKNSVPANLPNHRKPLQASGADAEEIKDTFYSYNGRAQTYAEQAKKLGFDPKTQPYEGSPYVMNNFDTVHRNMGIITRDGGSIDGIDTRYGAFTIYARIGGSTTENCSAGAVAGDAVKTAINYAWPDYHPPPYCREKSSYKQAIEAAADRGEYTGGTCTIGGTWVGVDCGAFITRVMRDSGADPKYNKYEGTTIAQQKYLDEQVSSGKYERLNVRGTSDLKPGDIAINSEHTFMFVGSQPGFRGNTASASFSSTGSSWRAPMANTEASGYASFSWYRLKAGG